MTLTPLIDKTKQQQQKKIQAFEPDENRRRHTSQKMKYFARLVTKNHYHFVWIEHDNKNKKQNGIFVLLMMPV